MLDQTNDTGHALAKLSCMIDWEFLDERLGAGLDRLPGPDAAAPRTCLTADHGAS
jgi:hypothetical protein